MNEHDPDRGSSLELSAGDGVPNRQVPVATPANHHKANVRHFAVGGGESSVPAALPAAHRHTKHFATPSAARATERDSSRGPMRDGGQRGQIRPVLHAAPRAVPNPTRRPPGATTIREAAQAATSGGWKASWWQYVMAGVSCRAPIPSTARKEPSEPRPLLFFPGQIRPNPDTLAVALPWRGSSRPRRTAPCRHLGDSWPRMARWRLDPTGGPTAEHGGPCRGGYPIAQLR